ncbi:MAG: hypothetical protein ACOCUL_01310 [Bacteroidota bacterium]
MNNSGDTLNFLDSVLNGYLNQENPKEFLEKYFYREFKKAEKKFYDAEEFFKGCLSVTNFLFKKIEHKHSERRIELLQFKDLTQRKIKESEQNNESKNIDEFKRSLADCSSELESLDLNDFSVHLPQVTNNNYNGNMWLNEVLFIENKIIEAFQKCIDEHAMENNNLITNDIDFNLTVPEYFLNKERELQDKFRVQFIVNRKFIEDLGEMGKGHKVGDIASKYPDWPENKAEAFELFENYYSKSKFLIEVAGFLNKIFEWNEKAMTEKLDEINDFIEEAKQIKQETAYQNVDGNHREMQKRICLRLKHGYYKTKNIKFDCNLHGAAYVYGKYFLFKKLLEEKIKFHSDSTGNFSVDSRNFKKLQLSNSDYIENAHKIIEPLNGYWNGKRIMNKSDFEMLAYYIEEIIQNHKLPQKIQKFKRTNTTQEFIRKTIHLIYLQLGKKYKNEFIELIHLFEQFDQTVKTTTFSKFSVYKGDYENDLKNMITY